MKTHIFVSPLRFAWIYQSSWRSKFLCSCQRTTGSVKPPCRCFFQTCFSCWCCCRHRVKRNRKDGVWRRRSQGTFNASGVGICPCTRFVFRFWAIFFYFMLILVLKALIVCLPLGISLHCRRLATSLRPASSPAKSQMGLLLQVTQTRHWMCWRRKRQENIVSSRYVRIY